jgi:uncharacterized Zn-binding protein involved in type VI secretion
VGLQASAQELGLVGFDGLQLSAKAVGLEVLRAAEDGSVVDFSARPLAVAVGEAEPLVIDLAAERGARLAVMADLEIGFGDLLQIDGRFAFELDSQGALTLQGSADVSIGDSFSASGEVSISQGRTTVMVSGKPVAVDTLIVAAADLDAALDLSLGSRTDASVDLAGLDLAFALYKESSPQGGQLARTWTALKARADEVAIDIADLGIPAVDGLTVSATSIGLEFNRSSGGKGPVPVLDWSAAPVVVGVGRFVGATRGQQGRAPSRPCQVPRLLRA